MRTFKVGDKVRRKKEERDRFWCERANEQKDAVLVVSIVDRDDDIELIGIYGSFEPSRFDLVEANTSDLDKALIQFAKEVLELNESDAETYESFGSRVSDLITERFSVSIETTTTTKTTIEVKS
jgi:hypothetical protein